MLGAFAEEQQRIVLYSLKCIFNRMILYLENTPIVFVVQMTDSKASGQGRKMMW